MLVCPHLKMLQMHMLARCFKPKLMALLCHWLGLLVVGISCQVLIMPFGNARLISCMEFFGLWDC